MFKSLDEEDRSLLELPFQEREIKEAIWNCEGSKSPEPEGYFLLFVKRCWSFLKNDLVACFRNFHARAVLSKAITLSFLALISKSNNPLGLDEYKPICLVGCIYKILYKFMVGRIKKVIGKVISLSQSTFVSRRQLLDGILIANGMVDYATKKKKSCLLFKVDFEKVYDKVSWHFLCYMLKSMGFGDL